MIAPEDHDRALKNIKSVLGGVSLGGDEYTAITKNGDRFPVMIHSSRILDKEKPTGLRGIIIDLTEQKKAEDALKEREDIFRSI